MQGMSARWALSLATRTAAVPGTGLAGSVGMDTATATERPFLPGTDPGPRRRALAAGLLMGMALAPAATKAVELNPQLRLPPQDPAGVDITRRPEEPRNITPRSRSRPELDPLGARIRSFMLLTSVDLGLGYNDNLRATQEDRQTDRYSILKPRAEIRSGWSRHALGFGADATLGRYQDFTNENYDDWQAFLNGRLDLGRASSLSAEASVRRLHEDAASPDAENAVETSQYKATETRGVWTHPFGRFEFQLSADITDYRFESVQTAFLPPGTLTGADRNRQATSGEGRLAYSVWPGYGAFIRAGYTRQDYDSRAPDGTDRDSTGYTADVGLDLELTDLIFGDVSVGYYHQKYADADFAPNSGLGFGANVYWNVTQLSTLHLEVNRSVQQSTQPGASGYLGTQAALQLEHELLRNLLLFAGTSRTQRTYEGLDREETLYQHNFGVTYMLNRHLYLRLRGVHRNQHGTDGGRDFTQNFVEQTLVLQH